MQNNTAITEELIASLASDDPFAEIDNAASQSLSKAQASEVIAKLTQPSKRTKMPSLELRYARMMAEDPDFAVAKRGDDVHPYQWKGNYWKSMTKFEAEQHAFNWLERFAPACTTNKLASQCAKSALLSAQHLNPKPPENIIPLMDCWIFVEDDGTLMVKKPDRSYGITYQIKASLNADEGIYQPPDLPQDGYLSKFLHGSLPDVEVREFVAQQCGATLLADTRFQFAAVWVGNGSNGKSVLVKLLEALHSKTAAIRLDKMEGFGLASIVDASLAVSTETPKRGINEQILKACISSDPIVVEQKGKNEFTYRPYAKFVIACNSAPRIQDETDGVFRRLQIVNWTVQMDATNKIDRLDELIITHELHHVVNWCLSGLQRLLKQGKFEMPAVVAANTQSQKEMGNSVLTFTQDYFVEQSTSGSTIAKEAMYNIYKEYCEEQSLTPFGNVEFWSRMRVLYKDMKETKKRVAGKQKRHVDLTFAIPMEEVSQEEIDAIEFEGDKQKNQLTTKGEQP